MVPYVEGEALASIDDNARAQARARQSELTKPPGSLGRLEALAVQLAALQGRACPRVDQVRIAVFAADHGVAAEGVSAFPQAVTAEMVRNFAAGGAAISVLARQLGATLEVVDVGTVHDPGPCSGVRRAPVASGTANLRRQPAMTPAQYDQALAAGGEAADRAAAAGTQLFIGGEMGIANTTSAAAVAAALADGDPHTLAGPGTGLDSAGVHHKADVIAAALARHGDERAPAAVLAGLGGFEIVALAGAFLRCGRHGIPVLVDGFISSVAALAAVRLQPALRPWLLFAHRSAEPGHSAVLAALEADPLLDLGMRLGEGSGAAVAVPLLRAACALHADMATFADAGVPRG